MSTQSTEFEKKFSSLLQEGKKDEAKTHLATGKDDDIKGLTRVAKCRAVVLMQGQADDVKNAAMAPRYLKLTKEQLLDTLMDAVGQHKKTGKATPKQKKKAKGTLPSPGKATKKKAVRRGLKPGGGPPAEGEEEDSQIAEDQEKAAAAEESEKAEEKAEEPETDKDSPETPSVDPGAAQELLEHIKEEVSKQLEQVDEKMGEVLINTNAVVKALSEVKGQESQSREALQKFEQFDKNFQVLYEQNGFLIECIAMIGSGVMDVSPDEFRQSILDQMEARAKERAEKLPKSTAKEGTDKSEEGAGEDNG